MVDYRLVVFESDLNSLYEIEPLISVKSTKLLVKDALSKTLPARVPIEKYMVDIYCESKSKIERALKMLKNKGVIPISYQRLTVLRPRRSLNF